MPISRRHSGANLNVLLLNFGIPGIILRMSRLCHAVSLSLKWLDPARNVDSSSLYGGCADGSADQFAELATCTEWSTGVVRLSPILSISRSFLRPRFLGRFCSYEHCA